MIETLLLTRPKDSAGGDSGPTKDEIVRDKAIEINKSLPDDYIMIDVRSKVKNLKGKTILKEKRGFDVPLNIFLF